MENAFPPVELLPLEFDKTWLLQAVPAFLIMLLFGNLPLRR